jgi:hypothetical protein
LRFGLIVRGQYPQGDDMRVRLEEDLEAAKRAEQVGRRRLSCLTSLASDTTSSPDTVAW